MKILELKKDKSKLVLMALGLTVGAALISFLFMGESTEVGTMDFSAKPSSSELTKSKNREKALPNKIIKPDPAYKEAPEFEDFQPIAKMFVHAMKPFKKEVQEWEADLLSLRLQRERIKLFTDGAIAAEGEAKMYKWREKSAQYKRGEGLLEMDTKKETASFGSEDIRNADSLPEGQPIAAQYTLANIRLTLYAPGNKYSKTAVSFKLGEERFYRVKVNQVFASQFLISELDDQNFCATIKDLSNDKQSLVCRN